MIIKSVYLHTVIMLTGLKDPHQTFEDKIFKTTQKLTLTEDERFVYFTWTNEGGQTCTVKSPMENIKQIVYEPIVPVIEPEAKKPGRPKKNDQQTSN